MGLILIPFFSALAVVNGSWWQPFSFLAATDNQLETTAPPRKEISDSDDFKEILSKSKFSLIYFYSESCKYCTEFEIDFQYLNQLYSNNDEITNQFQILRTNANKNKVLSELFGVNSYPSIKLLNFKTLEIFNFDKQRSLENLIEFIGSHTQVEPNYNTFKSSIITLTQSNFQEFLSFNGKDKLIVFIASYMYDWKKYTYPQHFYQYFPAKYNNIDFGIIDIEDEDSSYLREYYKVSNSPSLVYVDKELEKIKTFQTIAQNHLTNKRLTDENLQEFILNINNEDDSYGTWYKDISSLQESVVGEFDGYKNMKSHGFNVGSYKSHQDTIQSLEDEFNEILLSNEL
ncbi:hypothetical protein CAAN1_02S02454 [[Candida] anglica]|uniref:Thioredoxin domain-containing protein n=1 Tax=[Candida] anglica TaxID=148631 RepID=A0ABP0E9H6_9ASCO